MSNKAKPNREHLLRLRCVDEECDCVSEAKPEAELLKDGWEMGESQSQGESEWYIRCPDHSDESGRDASASMAQARGDENEKALGWVGYDDEGSFLFIRDCHERGVAIRLIGAYSVAHMHLFPGDIPKLRDALIAASERLDEAQ